MYKNKIKSYKKQEFAAQTPEPGTNQNKRSTTAAQKKGS